MISEIEAAATNSLGSLFRRRARHSLPLGSPCPNCATSLEGPFCHACGQRAEDYHRSIARLGAEALEGLFEADGRLFRTLPRLILKPGRLTRDFLEGHRTPQIPPFRLFLIVVVIVFFAGGLQRAHRDLVSLGPQAAQHSAEITADLAKGGVRVGGGEDGFALVQVDGAKSRGGSPSSGAAEDRVGEWLNKNAGVVARNQDAVKQGMNEWGHRLAILTLPMSAAILGLMFVWRRKFYIYDHLIFSMHSLSFLGLLFSTIMVLNHLTGGQGWWTLILAAPVHLFIHMRGVYGRGVITTLLRMFVLFVASSIGGSVILLMVLILGIIDAKGRTTQAAEPPPAVAPRTPSAVQPVAQGAAGKAPSKPAPVPQ